MRGAGAQRRVITLMMANEVKWNNKQLNESKEQNKN